MSIDIIARGTNGNNFWLGRAGHSPIAICDHIMQGTMESTLSWFRNPASEVSAHFGVAKDGRVWLFVDPANTAWANGPVNKPDLSIKWLAQAISDRINPNYLTISIEHEGNSGDVMPESQFQATIELHRRLIKEFGITPDGGHIIRHSQINSVQKANCPGPGFPMNRLLTELNSVDKSFIDPVTGLTVHEPFASFYFNQGGLRIFGRPMTAETTIGAAQFNCTTLQWFERARFENHAGIIALGLVGNEARELAGF